MMIQMTFRTSDDRPISEQFRVIAKKWCEADHAASLMEETRTAILSEIIAKTISHDIAMPYNKAEMAAKSSADYRVFVSKMVELRKQANLFKVQMEYIRMRFSEQQSAEATARSERRRLNRSLDFPNIYMLGIAMPVTIRLIRPLKSC